MKTQKCQKLPTNSQGVGDVQVDDSTDGKSTLICGTDGKGKLHLSSELQHVISTGRISSGIADLDQMLGGKGFFQGSSVLLSGPPGGGKSSFAAHFAHATCREGRKVIYFAFDTTAEQIVRDMHSIRIDMKQWLDKGCLQVYAARAWAYSLADHLHRMLERVGEIDPEVVIVDPVSSLLELGAGGEAKIMLTCLVDQLKSQGVTLLMTSLATGEDAHDPAGLAISDLVDAWLSLRDVESSGERNQTLAIIKSRGMSHSHQIREYLITDRGVELADVYVGSGPMLTGSARLEQEAQEKTACMIRNQEIERMQVSIERKRRLVEAQIAALQAEFEAEEAEVKTIVSKQKAFDENLEQNRFEMALNRNVNTYW